MALAAHAQRQNVWWERHHLRAVRPAVRVEALLPPVAAGQVQDDVNAVALVLPPDVAAPPVRNKEKMLSVAITLPKYSHTAGDRGHMMQPRGCLLGLKCNHSAGVSSKRKAAQIRAACGPVAADAI